MGSGSAGGAASRLAVESITRYVSSTMRCYHAAGSSGDVELQEVFCIAALEAHDAVRAEAIAKAQAEGRTDPKGMATTLTLALAIWPWVYTLQVGDSRCYHYSYSDGTLHQVTHDQTLAQGLVDDGVLPAERLASSPFSHVLSSAIGAEAATPVVTRIDIRRGCVILLCSDGLTKHVTDQEINEECRAMESSEQLCHTLLDRALSAGGSDNITVIAARARGMG